MSFIVGLTGGIGSGKSTISKMFATCGVKIIDADIVARDIVSPMSYALQIILSRFGSEIVNTDGTLNRNRLKHIIFADTSERKWLENLTHPLIRKEIIMQIEHTLPSCAYIILVSPLLIESRQIELVNRVLVVDVSRELQISRVMLRDNASREQVEQILSSQLTRKSRLKYADDIIDGGKAMMQLKQDQLLLHQQYLQCSRSFV